jgi:hypothetical protein
MPAQAGKLLALFTRAKIEISAIDRIRSNKLDTRFRFDPYADLFFNGKESVFSEE